MNRPQARAFSLVDISERAFNRPLMITPEKAQIVLGVIGPRLNVSSLVMQGEGGAPVPIATLQARAVATHAEMEKLPGDDALAPRDWNTGAVLDPYEIWNGAAIIPARGTLMAENGLNPASGATGYDGLSYKIRHAHEAWREGRVKGIALDIDSPGGEVVDLMELCHQLLAIREDMPIRAIVRGCAASAGYALASCASPGQITSAPYSMVGSIGAIMMHADWSKNLENDGIAVTLITSAAHKADGTAVLPLAEDVRERLEASVKACASSFIDHVAEARPVMSRDAIEAQEARFYTGEDALGQGLVDKFMAWDESLREFATLLNGSGSSGRAARPAPGARSMKGSTMDPNAQAPAGNEPVYTEAQMSAAKTETAQTATAAATTAERARISALAELDSDSTLSASLTKAINEGTSAGDYAIGLARENKAAIATAAEAAKSEAVRPGELPSGRTAHGGQANRGQAAVDRLRGKIPGLPAKAG
ncbi:S49 family peptidase [Sphingobium sp. LMC3-1-1.1]|uniref:S49 family peptidase n=1 Tax=Sphingobium sp. LMC3-1-1.1 TaxID=3135241 RepID=UPI003436C013